MVLPSWVPCMYQSAKKNSDMSLPVVTLSTHDNEKLQEELKITTQMHNKIMQAQNQHIFRYLTIIQVFREWINLLKHLETFQIEHHTQFCNPDVETKDY